MASGGGARRMPSPVARQYRAALEAYAAGQWDASQRLCEEILQRRPETGEAWDRLARLAERRGELLRAAECQQRAADLLEQPAEALANLGVLRSRLGQRPLALAAMERALALGCTHPVLLSNLGCLWRDEGRLTEAVELLERAVAAEPGNALARTNLGATLALMGRTAEALRHLERAVVQAPQVPVVHQNLLLTLHYSDVHAPSELLERARAFGRLLAPLERPLPARPVGERVVVGLASADLRQHPVKYFLEPLLQHLDRARFKVVAFSDVAAPDAVTAQLQAACDGWVDCVGLPDEVYVARVHEAGVDVLVDLAGHTAGSRLSAFARRAAPAQVTYLGYPGTTGLGAMDARVVDAWTDPPGTAEALSTERLLRMEGGFLCWSPGVAPTPVVRAAGRPFTFGCFNNLAKLSPAWMRLAAQVLQAVPEARLLLKNRSLADARTREHVARSLVVAGVPSDRVELRLPQPQERDHLAAYAEVDVALDSFPYHGTTTTLEALWMGTPVLSLVGAGHHARVGASLLSQVGLGELAVREEASFVAAAARLARDRAALSALHGTLRARLQASSLMDAAGRARAFERVLLSALEARRAPGSGTVPPP